MLSDPTTGYVYPYPNPPTTNIGITTTFQLATAPTGTPVNILSHGAVAGNSGFDNRAAIQAAINACPSGGSVLIPAGTFYVKSGPIYGRDNVSVVGVGPTSIIRVLVASVLTSLFWWQRGKTNARVTDFKIEKDGASAAVQFPLRFGEGSGSTTGYTAATKMYVARMDISGYERMGVVFENVKWGFLWDNDIYDPTAFGVGGQGYGFAFSGPNTEECWAIDNRFGKSGHVIRHAAIIQYHAHNNLVEENSAWGNTQDAYDFHGENEYRNELRLNHAYEATRSHASCSGGVCFPAGVGVGEYGPTHDKSGPYNWIHDNEVDETFHSGYRINGGVAGPTDIVYLTDNVVTGISGSRPAWGFAIGDLGLATNVYMRGNSAVGCAIDYYIDNTTNLTLTESTGTDATSYNLDVSPLAQGYVITDNNFRRGTVRFQSGSSGTASNNANASEPDPAASGTPQRTFTLNAYVYATRTDFTLDAWVVGGRHRHHRTRDHFGADSDLYIGLSEAIGPWPPGTPIKYVIADLYSRQVTLASYSHFIRTFTLDAYVLAPGSTSGSGTIRSVFTLNSTVKKARSSSFTLDAYVIHGGHFTLDAYVRGYGSFTLNAYVV